MRVPSHGQIDSCRISVGWIIYIYVGLKDDRISVALPDYLLYLTDHWFHGSSCKSHKSDKVS